jgi:hypothetical protein
MAPYDYWGHDGTFFSRRITREVWGEAFAWIRDFLGKAPQISEAGHDQLIGWLDGAQANQLRVDATASGFAWRIQAEDAERIPWFDFAYHDLFILHGAGYEDRYAAGLDLRSHGMYSSDYIATEVLTGRPAMVSEPFSRDVVRKYWLLDGLARALALRRIERVEFAGGNLHRHYVLWDNGVEVWVNRGQETWSIAGRVLPPYGFYARKPGLIEAGIDQAGEFSRSSEAAYDGAVRVTRVGDAVQVTPLPDSPRFTARLDWSALPWKLGEPSEAEALDERETVIRRLPVRREGGRVVVECERGVFAYRLKM